MPAPRVARATRMIVFPLLLLAAFAGTRFGPGPAAASTTVCGHVIGAETWTAAGSPYLVACDVIVDPGSVLTIQAGVTVLALGQYEILVHGYLFATGSSNGTILFAANNTGPPPCAPPPPSVTRISRRTARPSRCTWAPPHPSSWNG